LSFQAAFQDKESQYHMNKFPGMIIELPRWRKQLPDLSIPDEETKGIIIPTFIVSIGPTGRAIILRVLKDLKETHGTTRVGGFSYLHVDIHTADAKAEILSSGKSLISEDTVVLTPNIDIVERNYKQPSMRHIRWWYSTDIDSSCRSMGRLGLMNDLIQGFEQSKIYTSLRGRVSRPGTKLWVIASAADSLGANIAFDIALLAQKASNKQIDNSGLILLLHDTRVGDEVDAYDREVRTLASLEELDRLHHNRQVHFHYNLTSPDSQLRISEDHTIYDQVFILNAYEGSIPITGQPSNTIQSTAEFLLDQLNSKVDSAVGSWISSHVRVNDEITLTSSLGVSSFRLPLNVIADIIKWRMVDAIIDHWRKLLLGDEQLTLLHQSSTRWLSGEKGNYAPRKPFFQYLASILKGSPTTLDVSELSNIIATFEQHLIQQVVAILNGEDSSFITSSGRLKLAVNFLEQMSLSFQTIQRRIPTTPLGVHLEPLVSVMIEFSNNLVSKLKLWERNFRRVGLPDMIQAHLDSNRNKLKELLGEESWKEPIWSEDSEEKIFSALCQETDGRSSPLHTALHTTGWLVEVDENNQLFLNFAVYPVGTNPKLGSYTPVQKEEIVDALFILADLLGRNYLRKTLNLSTILEKTQGMKDQAIAQIMKCESLSLEYDIIKAASLTASSEKYFLLIGDETTGEALLEKLPRKYDSFILVDDKNKAVGYYLRTNISLQAVNSYVSLKEGLNIIDPRQYVFAAEAISTQALRKARKANPKRLPTYDATFRSLLHDGELVELFVRSAVKKVIYKDDSGKIIFKFNERVETLSHIGYWEDALQCFTMKWPGEENSPLSSIFKRELIGYLDLHEIDWNEDCNQFRQDVVEPMKSSREMRIAWIIDVILEEIGND
jgi:hypothetical protein